jgi:hypothetical protein
LSAVVDQEHTQINPVGTVVVVEEQVLFMIEIT